MTRPIDILLVEDNPGDVLLTTEALAASTISHTVRVAVDGPAAMAQLRHDAEVGRLPDLVLLDVCLPGMSGHDVLTQIKDDAELTGLPVVMLSSSKSDGDVRASYEGHASCYVAKPGVLDDYLDVVQSIERFWSSTVCLPGRE
jgi:chemotaxis family two-component system response regulator Rcp1